MAKTFFNEHERERDILSKRMDRFDSIVIEFMRKHPYTMEELGEKLGCSASSLWRYRTKMEAFKKAPFDVVCRMFKLANVSNENMRYILGLPTGKADNEET